MLAVSVARRLGSGNSFARYYAAPFSRLGRSADGMVEILNGLPAGAKVVTSGALFIDRAASSD